MPVTCRKRITTTRCSIAQQSAFLNTELMCIKLWQRYFEVLSCRVYSTSHMQLRKNKRLQTINNECGVANNKRNFRYQISRFKTA